MTNNERISFSEIALAAKTTISRYPRIKIAKSCAIRFLQDVGWGFGDYTQERQHSLKNVTRSNFWQDIQDIRARKDIEN